MATLILRPNGDSFQETDNGSWSKVPSETTYFYQCVDEETADDDTTYVDSGTNRGTNKIGFDIENSSVSGTINSVKVYMRGVLRDPSGSNASGYIILRISSTDYTSDVLTDYTSETWTTYNYTWSNNPNTSSSWTWSDINNLVIGGYYEISTTKNTYMYISQMYIEVDYTPSVDTVYPQIRMF